MHLECAIYKSQMCNNTSIANVPFKPQAEQNLLLRARTLIKFERESHSCFQQWRKDLAKKSLISHFESYIWGPQWSKSGIDGSHIFVLRTDYFYCSNISSAEIQSGGDVCAIWVCAAPSGRVFAPLWSENRYRLCPFWSGIGYGFRGNHWSEWTYVSFWFQMSKKERGMGKLRNRFCDLLLVFQSK